MMEVPDNLLGNIPSKGSDEAEFWQDDIISAFGFVGNMHML